MGVVKGNDNIKISDYVKYKFNEVTDKDVSRPDLTGYEVTYHED